MLTETKANDQAYHNTRQGQDHPDPQFLQMVAQTHAWQFFLFIVVFSHIVFLVLRVFDQFTEMDADWQWLFDGTGIGKTL
jgi:hypothetical protein